MNGVTTIPCMTGTLPGAAESTRQICQLHKDLVLKTQIVALSNVSTEDFQIIQATTGLQLDVADQPPFAAPSKSVDAFYWDDVPESNPGQAERLEYIFLIQNVACRCRLRTAERQLCCEAHDFINIDVDYNALLLWSYSLCQ